MPLMRQCDSFLTTGPVTGDEIGSENIIAGCSLSAKHYLLTGSGLLVMREPSGVNGSEITGLARTMTN